MVSLLLPSIMLRRIVPPSKVQPVVTEVLYIGIRKRINAMKANSISAPAANLRAFILQLIIANRFKEYLLILHSMRKAKQSYNKSMRKIQLVLIVLGLCLIFLPTQATAQSIYVGTEGDRLIQPPLLPKTVLLTFDDGPSPYTSQILDILREKHVEATFFIIGKEAVAYPVLDRIYTDGHEIGNHTYTHPDLSTLPDWRIRLELNLTRMIISSQTDHATRLFRPPFLGSDTLTPSSLGTVHRAAELGYISVGETIDSEDWHKPGVDKIISNATNGSGGIILLHDGGGDRSQTVQALPKIIDYYQSQGYQFKTVSEALNVPRGEVLLPLSPADHLLALCTKAVLTATAWLLSALRIFIIVLIIASFGRFLLVVTAALVQSRRKRKHALTEPLACSIIVPAYNESAVIQSCLKSVLASHYERFEVIVVDDGSSDNTFELASTMNDRRLRVLRKENGGKASALNHGIAHAYAPFVVAIDADTIFRPQTVAKLMRHFANPRIGAVSGNVKIVNRHKLITKLQSIEYIVGLNMERRMGDLFDCITVVPGAVGAFRRAAIQRAGGFSFDTLTEDTDLTFSIKEAGYTILYDSEAIAFTEAPATIKDLLKQRFRWTFGTMQVAWKHKRSFLDHRQGTFGMIGLPYLVFFQILFPLFGPFFDLAMIFGLLSHRYSLIVTSFVVYTLLEVVTATIALKLDNEKLRTLWILIPQRILYRQLMYYVIIRSVINVLKGRLVHWGKLERKGAHLAKSL
jgi:cellulose synthase/poly-beta-1,6-N-acetylglucosamine synthase-like glycosyltransferase/peptidoglycan/xylan/chitin deacetylase (PgdA/CDA1 family)